MPSERSEPIVLPERLRTTQQATIVQRVAPRAGRHSPVIPRVFRRHTPATSLDAFNRRTRLDGMAAIKGRARRPANAPTVLMQLRVSPESRAILQNAAEECGVSAAQYADALLRYLDQELGQMPRLYARPPQAEELPIPAS